LLQLEVVNVTTGLPEVDIIGGICGYSIVKTVGGSDILKDSSPTLILVMMKRLVSPP
jgi:hypothetical protein